MASAAEALNFYFCLIVITFKWPRVDSGSSMGRGRVVQSVLVVGAHTSETLALSLERQCRDM